MFYVGCDKPSDEVLLESQRAPSIATHEHLQMSYGWNCEDCPMVWARGCKAEGPRSFSKQSR